MKLLPSDKVRILFVLSAVCMVLLYPIFSSYIPEPPVLTYVGIIVLTVLAAFTTMRSAVLLAIDTLIASCGIVAFEFYAVGSINDGSPFFFFFINQMLALLFLVALYFSIRGLVIASDISTGSHEA